jgi:predicted RNA methylase
MKQPLRLHYKVNPTLSCLISELAQVETDMQLRLVRLLVWLGLLAMMASRHGARKVYACEVCNGRCPLIPWLRLDIGVQAHANCSE